MPITLQHSVHAAQARPYDGMVIVTVGRRVTLVAVEGEFPLGIKKDDDRIARQISNHRLVSVRLVKK